jgi:transposase
VGTAATYFAGIDVSKDTLDACLLTAGGRPQLRQFANGPAGHAALAGWAERRAGGACHFCLESTGPYGDALAEHWAGSGRLVSVVNPARIKYAGLARGQGNKTDPADARLIAEYARDRTPPAWRPPAPERRELAELGRRLADVQELAARETTRLARPGLPASARRSLERSVAFLGEEADRLRGQMDALIAGDPGLRDDRALLESVPGVGAAAARMVLAELPQVGRLPSAQSAAAYAGLAPREYRSGSSVRRRTRLSKAGNARLRKALFFPAVTACRFNPVVQALFDRLVAAGQPRMAAVGACLRKLLMLCSGVLKSRRPFDPAWSSKPTTAP